MTKTLALSGLLVALGACGRADDTAPQDRHCFLLLDLGTGETTESGDSACSEKTVPASTFKVPHALIALQLGIVTDPDAKRKWDGRDYWNDRWEADHSLRTALQESVVWFFQSTAREIGKERMRHELRALDYGNAKVSDSVDKFWLDDGSLRLTAHEQLAFLHRMHDGKLPVDPQHVATVLEIMRRDLSSMSARVGKSSIDLSTDAVLRVKTGTASIGTGAVTWFIGFAERDGRSYAFVSRVVGNAPPSVHSPAVVEGITSLRQSGAI